MAVAALQPVDYQKLIKGAIGAGVLTLVLTVLVVGIETVSSPTGITFEPAIAPFSVPRSAWRLSISWPI